MNESAPDEFVVHLVIAQNVARRPDKTFYALSEFLHTIDVLLLHTPCAVRRIWWSRFERLDLFLHPKIP
jgi:hypothetical protein